MNLSTSLAPAVSPRRAHLRNPSRLAAAACLGLLTLILGAGCAGRASVATATPRSCCLPITAANTPLPDRSLYQVESSWTNDARESVHWASLRGRPRIVTLFFASCQFACPVLVHDMKEIESALPESLRARTGFVLVSIDPQRDTPEALARFRQNHALPETWTVLRGGNEDVLELAALLGVQFKQDASGQFAHSNVITLLDDDGEIVFQQIGLHRDPAPAVEALQRRFTQSGP